MLIRFVIENVFSFGEQKEFSMFPNKRLRTLVDHKYTILDFELLKLASIYGANGAGKSNLVKSLQLFKDLVTEEDIPLELKKAHFKFNGDNNRKQTLAIEFIEDNTPFYYGVEFLGDIVVTEELYLSGLGQQEDKLIFERTTDTNKQTTLTFLEDFERDEKSQMLKSILLEEFIQPHKTILKLISNRDNKFLQVVKKAFNWFAYNLQTINPTAKPRALAHLMDLQENLRQYANEVMCSFNVGITSLNPIKQDLQEFVGEDDEFLEKLTKVVENSPLKMLGLSTKKGNEIIVVKENDKIYVKQLDLEHKGKDDKTVTFELEEESDGTIRLLDFIPVFWNILNENKVYIIDEIERSIHPLLIKELVKKFSLDPATKGQLIFTTHESNLLDQDIFRQDEIWFAEKDNNGSTDLYSLSDFKEHKTIDVRKGYLNGRYGAIPFLGNLQDLNWHKYDTTAP